MTGEIAERKQIEDAQLFLLQSNWAAEDFFEALARYLAQTLDIDFVCIDRFWKENGTCAGRWLFTSTENSRTMYPMPSRISPAAMW